MFPGNWDWKFIATAATFHGVAILSTLFRLWYRWYTDHLWWDDVWAAIAFVADVASLAVALREVPVPNGSLPRFFVTGNWILSFTIPIIMWTARISILTSVVRVSRPEGMLRYISIGTGVLFGLTGLALLAQRIQLCATVGCLMSTAVLIAQTTTDCIADVLLSILPFCCLRKIRLQRKRKILIYAVFSASMVINIVTVTEAVVCFQVLTSGSIIFEHLKLACTMIVCNLLVIVTFVFRILCKTRLEDLDDSAEYKFTTIDLSQYWESSWQSQTETKGTTLSASVLQTQSATASFNGGSRSRTAEPTITSGSGQIFVEKREGCS